MPKSIPYPQRPCPQCLTPCDLIKRHLPNFYCPTCRKWYRTDAPPPKEPPKIDYNPELPRGGFF
jgi:hypothetical protein